MRLVAALAQIAGFVVLSGVALLMLQAWRRRDRGSAMKRLLAVAVSGWIAAAVLAWRWLTAPECDCEDRYEEGFSDGERQAMGA